MSKSVGLEIHARGVRAVELTGRGKNVRVLRYTDTALVPRGGAPDPEELQDALNAIFKGAKYSRNLVVTSLPADETVVREIAVPFKSDDQIRKVIKYEAEHHLHDCDADDVVVQYTKIGESAEGANLLVFAARKSDIGRRIEYARGSGVEPLAMELDAVAFFNAATATGAIEETPTCVLVNIQHRATELVFVVDGRVRALRSVRLGVDSISQGLARDMDIELSEADSKLTELSGDDAELDLLIPEGDQGTKRETEKSHAELERDLFTHKRDDFVARLRREYVRSSASIDRAGQPTRILASGPGLKVPGLIELLGQRLGITVDAFLPSREFTYKANGISAQDFDAGAAVALGLALKGLGSDPLGLDFRQEELKVANKFELLKSPLAVSVTLVFLALMACAFFFVYKKNGLLRERFDPLVLSAYKQFSPVTEKYNSLIPDWITPRDRVIATDVETAGARPLAVKRFVRSLQTMHRKLTGIVGDEEGLPPITSALKIWNDIFGVISKMHKEIVYIDFDAISIKQNEVRLTVIMPSVASVAKITGKISELESMRHLKFDENFSAPPITGTDKRRVTLEWKKRK